MLCALTSACGGAIAVRVPAHPPTREQLEELWADPGDTPRDLFWGVGGKKVAPRADGLYRFESRDNVGFSSSYDVIDAENVQWSAKIGPEAQAEVVLSRILWGVGYHQPPLYYLPSWTLEQDGVSRTE